MMNVILTLCIELLREKLLIFTIMNNIYNLFLIYNQQDVTFLNLFISITLYLFRMEPPPNIRSSDCKYNFWYLLEWNSTPTMIATGSGKVWQIPEDVCTAELLMMGGGSTRDMYSIIEINKLRKVTSCWLYIRNISEDAQTYECQINIIFWRMEECHREAYHCLFVNIWTWQAAV
jgi:hypothetical protein